MIFATGAVFLVMYQKITFIKFCTLYPTKWGLDFLKKIEKNHLIQLLLMR